jgi:pSer/pThr/pTyr-binding forkhead associated (FHA) protein
MAYVLNGMTEVDATITGYAHILRRQRDTRRHSLEQFEGDGGPRVFTLDGDEMVIGRAPDAHVRLTSKRASRQHAFLRPHGPDCMLFDNDSHNGVFLNGVKVYSAVLRDGDVIQVADSIFVYSGD